MDQQIKNILFNPGSINTCRPGADGRDPHMVQALKEFNAFVERVLDSGAASASLYEQALHLFVTIKDQIDKRGQGVVTEQEWVELEKGIYLMDLLSRASCGSRPESVWR